MDVMINRITEDLFATLEGIPAGMSAADRYHVLGEVLVHAVDQKLQSTHIKFSGLFSKIDYLIKENADKWTDSSVAQGINSLRQRLRRLPDNTDRLDENYQYDMAVLCVFIGVIYSVDVPSRLSRKFPYIRKAGTRPLLHKGDTIRVIINRWTDNIIYATREDNGQECKVGYIDNSPLAMGDRTYLRKLLIRGEQLNLVKPRVADDIIWPELIIFNPDYLIDISSVASCFTDDGQASPYTYIYNKVKPKDSTEAIKLGNFASQLLDETLYHKDYTLSQSWKRYLHNNALELASSPVSPQFALNAKLQKDNIVKALNEALPEVTGTPYNPDNVILEPSFFCETLGLQGRMDFLQRDLNVIVEQKSGKGAFRYGAPQDKAFAKTQHYVQLLLYRALLTYNYHVDPLHLYTFLLYSKYQQPLVAMGNAPKLLFKAMEIRNKIAWLELYCSRGGFQLLDKLRPENITPYSAGSADFWNRYIRPRIENTLRPLSEASALEKAYYYRMLKFIANEHVLSKTGNITKEDSGFAAAWNESLYQKLDAGNIYDRLSIGMLTINDDGQVAEVTMKFGRDMDNDMSNFRQGDIVVLYPYNPQAEPAITKTITFRGSISAIDEGSVKVKLRNPQTDSHVFDYPNSLWAVEHDFMESSYNSLYRAMHLFINAPKRRRDLLLSQRKPKVNTSLRLNGDYTDRTTGNTEFNDLVLRAKQAEELFLIIGPPGTGKTSYGLLNVLREQLTEPGTSVAVMAYTNRAVDEICSKLDNAGIDYMRIGSGLGCGENYRSHLLKEKTMTCDTIEDIRKMILSQRVVCGTTTAFNSNISLIEMKHFDLAIVDEASQILEPQIIGLLCARCRTEEAISKFVLIGDEKQLPAVVQQTDDESTVGDRLLNEMGLYDCRQSLFERLIRIWRSDGQNNELTYMLTRQGRMHQDISEFPNKAFYGGKLIPVPLDHQVEPTPAECTAVNVYDRILTTCRVAFINCKSPDIYDMTVSDKVNRNEASLIANLVMRIWKLNRNTFDKDRTIGVIVPYRNQISTIRNLIRRQCSVLGTDEPAKITIDTVERFQGSQREYIIYGFTVRKYYQLNFLTNNQYPDSISGQTVDRKLNVAMTRAMKRLVMVGNAGLLENNPVFADLIKYCQDKNSYFDIFS